jgi:hypothetical protein
MRDSEARLQKDLEAVQARVRRLNQDMLLVEGVPAAGGGFSKTSTNLLVVCTRRPQMPYLVLVDRDLRYSGDDPFLAGVFAGQPESDGWRPLLLAPGHLTQEDLAEVARVALRLLGVPTPAAPSLPHGLNADWGLREAFPPLAGRDALLEEAEAALAQETERVAVVFTGPAGVGKTALCRELAWRWRQKEPGRTACRVDVPALLLGASLPAQRTERFQTLYREAQTLGPAALLVMEDLPFACATGVTRLALCQAIDAGVRLCATTLPSGLLLLRDPSLRRRLHTIVVPEPEPEELAETILPAVARHLEIRYAVQVTPEALGMVRRVARGRGAQPGRAIRVLDAALARARQKGLAFLGPDDVLG